MDMHVHYNPVHYPTRDLLRRLALLSREPQSAVGKTGRGLGVGDQWVKSGDWELGDHVTTLCFDYKLD